MTCRSDLPPVSLTAREHQEMRSCIERLRRLGIRGNEAVNLIGRMSVTLKKGARRAQKSSALNENAPGGIVDRKEKITPSTGGYERNKEQDGNWSNDTREPFLRHRRG